MLDEPSLSRQWVARRLQRALSVERWCGPLRLGFARSAGHTGQVLDKHGTNAAQRAARLEALIRNVGSEPYSSRGIGARTARLGGRLLPLLSSRLTLRAAGLVAEHTLSEYEALEAFVRDAPGIDAELAETILPMHAQVASELAELSSANGDQL